MGVRTAALIVLALVGAGAGAKGGIPAPTRLSSPNRSAPAFVENRGQWPETVRFHGRIGGTSAWIEDHALVLQDEGDGGTKPGVRMVFERASERARVVGGEARLGRYNYYFGDNPSRWVHGARSFDQVRWSALYPGIDLVLRSEPGAGRLKYDVHVAAGVDLSTFEVRCEGALGLRLDAANALVVESPSGPLFHAPGESWQLRDDGTKVPLECFLELRGPHRFGLRAPTRDPALALVIDPGLVWSTFLGSANEPVQGDVGKGIVYAPGGDVITAGWAAWFDFPVTPGSYQHPEFDFGHDVFVTRFRADDGEILYSSVIGGPDHDRAHAITVDTLGRAYVVGEARRAFPTTLGAFDTHADATNGAGFLLRMGSEGQLDFSTFIEGSTPFDGFRPEGVAVDSRDGSVVVGGFTSGTTLPVTAGAFDTSPGLASNGFIARFDSEGTGIIWGSYLGGNSVDDLWALDVDDQGRVAVTGETKSNDFPITPGVFQSSIGGPFVLRSVFVTVFAPGGDQLVWSSYLGGTTAGEAAGGLAVAFVPDEGVVVAGGVGTEGSASTFPVTPNALQPAHGGQGDGFLTRLSAGGTSLVYSTYLGSSTNNRAIAVGVDASGLITVLGTTRADFPITRGAFDATWAGLEDTFVARFSPEGSRLLYSTYFGGAGADRCEALALSSTGRVALIGTTDSGIGFPTTPDAPFPSYQGGQSDAFIAELDLIAQGVRLIGRSSDACLGPLVLNALEAPRAGAAGFGFYLSQAPPSSSGWLLVGAPAITPAALLGVGFFLERGTTLQRIAFDTDAFGYAEIPWPLVAVPAGASFAAQALVRTSAECPGSGEWSASNAVGISVW